MNSTELLSCPFCGGAAYPASETDDDDIRWHFIRCRGCGVRTRGKWHSPGNDCPQLRAEVRDEWNRRASINSVVCEAGEEPSGETMAYTRGYSAAQIKFAPYIERAVKLERGLQQIANMDPAGQRADDLGRAARAARDALDVLGVRASQAPEPVLWQWRRLPGDWSLEYTFAYEVKATALDSEVRALYADPVSPGLAPSHADETMRLAAEFAAAHAEWLYGPEEKQAENYATRAAAVGALRAHVRGVGGTDGR